MFCPNVCDSVYDRGDEISVRCASNGAAVKSMPCNVRIRTVNAESAVVTNSSAACLPSRNSNR